MAATLKMSKSTAQAALETLRGRGLIKQVEAPRRGRPAAYEVCFWMGTDVSVLKDLMGTDPQRLGTDFYAMGTDFEQLGTATPVPLPVELVEPANQPARIGRLVGSNPDPDNGTEEPPLLRYPKWPVTVQSEFIDETSATESRAFETVDNWRCFDADGKPRHVLKTDQQSWTALMTHVRDRADYMSDYERSFFLKWQRQRLLDWSALCVRCGLPRGDTGAICDDERRFAELIDGDECDELHGDAMDLLDESSFHADRKGCASCIRKAHRAGKRKATEEAA